MISEFLVLKDEGQCRRCEFRFNPQQIREFSKTPVKKNSVRGVPLPKTSTDQIFPKEFLTGKGGTLFRKQNIVCQNHVFFYPKKTLFWAIFEQKIS